jgi:peptidyl-prolyl cis-trans isomerase D
VEVRDKVLADATDSAKRKRFIALGQTLKVSIERGLKAGEPFEKAAEEAAGSVKLDVKSYPPFTYRSLPQGMDPSVGGALEHLEKGSVSDMQATADKGVLVYAADKKAPVLDPSNPRVAMVWRQLAMTYARTDSLGMLGDVVDREVKRMEAASK